MCPLTYPTIYPRHYASNARMTPINSNRLCVVPIRRIILPAPPEKSEPDPSLDPPSFELDPSSSGFELLVGIGLDRDDKVIDIDVLVIVGCTLHLGLPELSR